MKFLNIPLENLCLQSKLLEKLFGNGAPAKYDTLPLALDIHFCV